MNTEIKPTSEKQTELERELSKKENFRKRMKYARMLQGESRQTLAEQIGISANSVWQWESGRSNPSQQSIAAVCRILKVRKDWLLEGRGEMCHVPSASIQLKDHPEAEKLKELEQSNGMSVRDRLHWLKAYRQLSFGELANLTGMSIATLGFLFASPKSKHAREPSRSQYVSLAKAFNVNIEWLKFGLGQVEGTGNPSALPRVINKPWGEIKTDKKAINEIAERLRQCYCRRAIASVKVVAEAMELSPSTVMKHLSLSGGEVNLPYASSLQAYARYFDVPYEWLAYGQGDDPIKWHEFNREAFAANLDQAMIMTNRNLASLERDCDLRGGQINRWRTEKDYHHPPKPHAFRKLVDVLGVNFDWLWAGIGEMMPPKTHSTPVESDSPEATLVPDAQGDKEDAVMLPCQKCEKKTPHYRRADDPRFLYCNLCAANELQEFEDAQGEGCIAQYNLEQSNGAGNRIEDSPAAKYFPEPEQETAQVRVATLGAGDLESISANLNTAIANRDELLRQADLAQTDIDKWTTILLNKIGS
jgi:transcriptional regulator with XRE-family HTH domain